jgi:hypothetical protein
MKEHIKTFIDFLKNHEVIFHFAYTEKFVKEGNVYATLSIPKIYVDDWGPTLISLQFQDKALSWIIPLTTTLKEIFPILNELKIKRCWFSTNYNGFTELSLEQVVGGITVAANGQRLFIQSGNELFTDLSSVFEWYLEKLRELNQETIVIGEKV